MRTVISKEATIHTSEMLMHMELLGVVHQRREKTNKNKRNISSLVVCDDESSWEETWKTQKTQARIEWKCDQLLRQRRLRYSFMYVRGGRQTMINAIPSGSLSLLFLSNLFIPFFLGCCCWYFSPFHINWHLYNTQLPGAYIFMFVLLSCCCLPIHSRSVGVGEKTTKKTTT